jgi:hypothetical protein
LERDVRLIQAREAVGPLIDAYLFERLRFRQELPDLGAVERDTGAALDWYRPGFDIPPTLSRSPCEVLEKQQH